MPTRTGSEFGVDKQALKCYIEKMAVFRRFNLPQKVVVVVGVGITIKTLADYLASDGGVTGWTAYAPLSQSPLMHFALNAVPHLLINLVATTAWVIISLAVLT